MQSLEVPPLDYPDNAKVIELLEKRPTGIFPALDSQCKMMDDDGSRRPKGDPQKEIPKQILCQFAEL